MAREIARALAWLCAGAFVCGASVASAEAELPGGAETLRAWRASDGLLSDSVTAIIQTRDGFLWVGTAAGLVRFDGVQFTELKLPSTAAGPARVTALCEDAAGHLWIGTQQQGLFQLSHGRLRHWDAHGGLCDPGVTCLAADDRGQVWAGTKSGLNLWTEGRMKRFTTLNGLPADLVSGVSVSRSGTVWIATRAGMCRYRDGRISPYDFQTESQGRSPEYLGAYEDPHGILWAYGDTYLINLTEGKRFNYFRSSESASVRIWSLCEGQDGRLWIGTSGRGLYCFEENRFQPVALAENGRPYDVRALCEDRNGNLWLGTSGGGLLQLRRQSVHLLRGEQGLPPGLPSALATDSAGRLYFGLQRGGVFVDEAGRFDRADGVGGAGPESCVSSICVAPNGMVWAGTAGNGLYGFRNGRGIHLTTADGLADDRVGAVCADAAGAVWIGSASGALQLLGIGEQAQFETVSGATPARITQIIPASGGGLWLGTGDGEVWHEAGRRFTVVWKAPTREGQTVLAIYETAPGTLWIGTAGGGLSYSANGLEMNWGANNGLPGSIVAGIVSDEAGNLWLATDAGVYRVRRKDLLQSLGEIGRPLVCERMSSARTSLDPQKMGMRAARSKDGVLWFATSGGLVNADPRLPGSEAHALPVSLESAAFNGQTPVSLLDGPLWSDPAAALPAAKAPADVRALEIRFTALGFEAPEEIRFRHKLEGLDPDWVEDGAAREARYGRLAYGHYKFRVAARRIGGSWREAGQTFAFTVPAPFYRQTWALCLYGCCALAFVIGTVRLFSHRRLRLALARQEQEQLLERERLRIARDMHDEMGSKLTKISFLSERVRVDASLAGPLAEKVESIALTSRDLLKTMDEIVWVVNPRNDTLENLVAYLGHYAVEYFQNTSVECELRLPQDLPQAPLASEARHNLFLAFEEALNNVLKHSRATVVRVEMSARNQEFELTVSDNGSGLDPAAPASQGLPVPGRPGGNGLRNMRQRLAAVGGECRLSSSPGKGATITLKIGLTQKTRL